MGSDGPDINASRLGQPYRRNTVSSHSFLPTELRLGQVKQECALVIFGRLDQLHGLLALITRAALLLGRERLRY